MKEIISTQNKKAFILPIVISILSIPAIIIYLSIDSARFLGIGGIFVFSLVIIQNIIFIIDPRPAIEKIEDKIIFRNGLVSQSIAITDIIEVSQTINKNGKKSISKNSIVIKAMVNNKEKTFICSNLTNPTKAIDKLNSLTNETKTLS